MISNFVNKIFGSPGSEISGTELDTKLSEEHPIYCATSLKTFYRPKRLKIAILDHLPCSVENLSIELFTTQKSGNFRDYILSNIQDKKKSKIPRHTLVMNGHSFYCVVSSSKKANCNECGSSVCSSFVIDFTRNSDNGEPTYLIFQGDVILRIQDRSSNLNIYSLATSRSSNDVINITKNEVILSIPNSFVLSRSFKINLILYSVIGWTRSGEEDKVLMDKKDERRAENDEKLDNLLKKNLSTSPFNKLPTCSIGHTNELNKQQKEIEIFDDTKTPINCRGEGNYHNNSGISEKGQLYSTPNSASTPISAILKAKAPPLPTNMKSAPRPRCLPKGAVKGSVSDANSVQKKKILPLGRRIHWKPLSEEMAQKTIFREILYTSLGPQSSPLSNQESEIYNTKSMFISNSYNKDTCLSNENGIVTEMSPMSNSVSPMTISDFHVANSIVHMETLSRVFTKSSTNTINSSGINSSSLNCHSAPNMSSYSGNNKFLLNPNKSKEYQKFITNDNKSSIFENETSEKTISENSFNESQNIKNDYKIPKDEQTVFNTVNHQKQLPLTFLSQKRAQNMAIVLSRLSVPIDYIIEVLKSFNVSSLTLEDYERIEQVLPTEQEIEKIKNNQRNELHQLEQFLSRFSHISNPMTRLRFLKFEHILDASEFDIQKNLNTLYSASLQMRNSSKLRLILKSFLLLGNYVNHGIHFSGISNSLSPISHAVNNESINWSLLETKGFALSSLLRLVEFKTAIDSSFTALHYIIANLTLNNQKLNLNQLPNDLHAVSEASKISVEALFACINDMRKELAILEIEKSKFSNERVEHLFESYSRRLDALIEGYHRIVEKVVDTALYFGQNIPEGNRSLIIQPFFETMNIFLLQFSSCCKEIKDKPMKFSQLLVDSSAVFSNSNDSNSSNSYSVTNSTSNSSRNLTPLMNNTPSTSFSKIPNISDSNCCSNSTKHDNLNRKQDSSDNNQHKKASVLKPSVFINSEKKETGNVIIIKTSDNNVGSNAFKLPNRPPPPKNIVNISSINTFKE
ncbi:formin 2 domain [Cryptosporidium ryanae]|uniref:formin 2 domain n=1 Tax=Cryptosporidium ryanae TaxID=515981 RepID=UPI00351A517F|nr:formin 2 domain [Cryptosporidium ryanae]